MSGKHFKTSSSVGPSSEQTGRIPVQNKAQAPQRPAPANPPIGGFAPGASPDDTFAFISAAGSPADFTPIDTSASVNDDRFASSGNKEEFYDFGYAVGADDSGNQGSRRRKKRKKKKNIWPAVVGVLVVLLVAIGACGFMLVRSAQGVRADAKTVLTIVEGMGSKIASGDTASMVDDAQQVVELSGRMKHEVSSPLWTIASFVPVYGEDIAAARTLSDVLDTVANEALVPVSDELAKNPVSKLIQDGGVINVDGVQTLLDAVVEVAPVLKTASVEVEGIGQTHIGKVTELVDKAKGVFSVVGPLADSADELQPILPAVLGADGQPRNYLVVAASQSEIRAVAGFAGSCGVMTVDNGHISLGEFEPVQHLDAPGLSKQIEVSDEEKVLFQPYAITMNYTGGDSYFTPDFPRGSWLEAEIWSLNHNGQRIDGVVSVSPIFLQSLLSLCAPVTASDGTVVDGSNAAQVLLSDLYWKYPTDNNALDIVFASIAGGAFDNILGSLGNLNLSSLVKVIAQGASDGFLNIWFRNPAEQQVIVELGADGGLPISADDPQTGLYVNNYSFGKTDWYLNIDKKMSPGIKNTDGSVSYQIDATLTNNMTEAEASDLPLYVTAHNYSAEVPGQQIFGFYLYAPMGGSISNLKSSYGEMTETTHNGLQVFFGEIRMKPGESVTVSYTVTVPAEGAGKGLEFRVTPTAQEARKAQMQAMGL